MYSDGGGGNQLVVDSYVNKLHTEGESPPTIGGAAQGGPGGNPSRSIAHAINRRSFVTPPAGQIIRIRENG